MYSTLYLETYEGVLRSPNWVTLVYTLNKCYCNLFLVHILTDTIND
jgi:hypothetical protein